MQKKKDSIINIDKIQKHAIKYLPPDLFVNKISTVKNCIVFISIYPETGPVTSSDWWRPKDSGAAMLRAHTPGLIIGGTEKKLTNIHQITSSSRSLHRLFNRQKREKRDRCVKNKSRITSNDIDTVCTTPHDGLNNGNRVQRQRG